VAAVRLQRAQLVVGTIAVSTTVTSTYSTVTMTSEPMMARGRSRLGLRVSSAAVATMSNR